MAGCSERRFNINRSRIVISNVQNKQKKNVKYVTNNMITTTRSQLRLQVQLNRNSRYAVQGKKMKSNNELGQRRSQARRKKKKHRFFNYTLIGRNFFLK